MPQVDLNFSCDIKLDVDSIFEAVEFVINRLDSSAGVCKSRAYPAVEFRHTHVLIRIAVLKKSHRDDNFMQTCLDNLKKELVKYIPEGCHYAIELFFMGDYYFTDRK